jgi:molybdopterin-binding protein
LRLERTVDIAARNDGAGIGRDAGVGPLEDLVRIGAAAGVLGVSVDTLRRWERAGRVLFERRGNQRFLAASELARLMRERGATGRSSARNRLHGVVVSVTRDTVMAQVEMACGPYRIVSLMSRESVDELDLKPGDPATAVIKATTVIVETR